MNNIDRVNKFRNEKIAVNCETEEEAKEFVKWCYRNGFEWRGVGKPTITNFDRCKDKTCYAFDFLEDKQIGFDHKYFYKEKGWEVIKFKDFMKEEKKMTRLEYVVSKGLNDESNTLCYIAHICKYGTECENNECLKCEFYKDINLCVQTLLEEYKEPIKIKLTKFEYDLLKAKIKGYGNSNFSLYKDLRNMKNKGYFKGVTDKPITLQEILDNCEVVE